MGALDFLVLFIGVAAGVFILYLLYLFAQINPGMFPLLFFRKKDQELIPSLSDPFIVFIILIGLLFWTLLKL